MTAISMGVLYTLVPEGRWRNRGKWVAAGLVAVVVVARVALGTEAPGDVLLTVGISVSIPLLAFRRFAPSEVFPVVYRRGRSAHMDVGGERGLAIRRALEDQLGLVVKEIKPFGLSGSAGSTPLRITLDGDPPRQLFAKLYAQSHLHADRWYKLGRELLYGVATCTPSSRGYAIPTRPIRVQRWSARRVALGAAIVLLVVLVALNPTVIFDNRMAVRTSLGIHGLDCGQLEPLWLEAQSVPSASLVPCVRSRVPGWMVADVAVNNGRSVITLDHDRAGKGAVEARLAASCDTAGAVEMPSPTQGVRRFQQVDRATDAFGATWYDRFPGGCVTYRLRSASDIEGSFAVELPGLLGFASRDALRNALAERSDLRLRLQ